MIFTRRVYSAYILTRTPPPPFAQVDGGGCYREKFFIFSESIINSFWLYFDSDFIFFVSPIRFLLVFYFFYFFWFSFGFFDIRFSVKLVYIRSILSRLRFLTSLLIFDSHRFRLISALSILCFISSTLYLFDSSAYYKQTSMLMWVCFMLVFSYFKAFWRVFVCFRCSLSSWVKIMRQKA